MKTPPFTLIFGPTSSGKTDLALELARKQSANILSFDSRQLYIGMDIVTGKDIPSEFQQKNETLPSLGNVTIYNDRQTKLYGFDIIHPDQEWSIAHFYEYAQAILSQHRALQIPLILVGGSWQYVDVLLNPPASLLVPVNLELRKKLEAYSTHQLQQDLEKIDPTRWNVMNYSDRSNPRRLIRAIEVAKSTAEKPKPLLQLDEVNIIFISADIDWLTSRIQKRIDERLAHGAIAETKKLMTDYTDWSSPAFSATGYALIRQHMEEKITEQELRKAWLLQERQYAKRQLTWLKALHSQYPQAKNIQRV